MCIIVNWCHHQFVHIGRSNGKCHLFINAHWLGNVSITCTTIVYSFTNEMRFWSDLHSWLHVVNFCSLRSEGVFVMYDARPNFLSWWISFLNFQNVEIQTKDLFITSFDVICLSIISEWPSLSDRLLWFLSIELVS